MPTRDTKVVAARVPNYLYDKLAITAKKRKQSVSSIIIWALKNFYQLK